MFDLAAYFPAPVLETAWRLGKHFSMVYVKDESNPSRFLVESHDAFGAQMLDEISRAYGEKEASTTALQNKCLHDFMKAGPVIVRPSLNLCQALADTEIRMSAADFRMAYPILAIELPKEVVGVHHPCLTFVWKCLPNAVMIWTMSPHDLITYHVMFGDDLPTLEDRLALQEGIDTESDRDLLLRASRISLNLGMLSAHRTTERTPLPRKIVNQRQANNRRVRQQGLQVAQELIFRDLVLKDHSAKDPMSPESPSFSFGKQHRKGHWKRQPFGPQSSQRKWLWINDYWTHEEEEGTPRPIILK